jgi:metal-responsive CopG/Arc/MetJ family transcriptional regulator
MVNIRLNLSKKESQKAERLKHKYKVNSKSEAIRGAIREVSEEYLVGDRK